MSYTDIHHPDIPPQVFQRIKSYTKHLWSKSPLRDRVSLQDWTQEAYLQALRVPDRAKPQLCAWQARNVIAYTHGYGLRGEHKKVYDHESPEPFEGFFDTVEDWEKPCDGAAHAAASASLRFRARRYLPLVHQRMMNYVYRDGLPWREAAARAGKHDYSGPAYKEIILRVLAAVAAGDYDNIKRFRTTRITQEAKLRGLDPRMVTKRLYAGAAGPALWDPPKPRKKASRR